MQLDIVTNKEIAQRLRCSKSKASRLSFVPLLPYFAELVAASFIFDRE